MLYDDITKQNMSEIKENYLLILVMKISPMKWVRNRSFISFNTIMKICSEYFQLVYTLSWSKTHIYHYVQSLLYGWRKCHLTFTFWLFSSLSVRCVYYFIACNTKSLTDFITLRCFINCDNEAPIHVYKFLTTTTDLTRDCEILVCEIYYWICTL